jgi:hypothetical protein
MDTYNAAKTSVIEAAKQKLVNAQAVTKQSKEDVLGQEKILNSASAPKDDIGLKSLKDNIESLKLSVKEAELAEQTAQREYDAVSSQAGGSKPRSKSSSKSKSSSPKNKTKKNHHSSSKSNKSKTPKIIMNE